MSESKPVVRLFFAKMKEAFINLPEEEKIAFMKKDRENLDKLGMKALSMIEVTGCSDSRDSSDSNDKWDYIGVEQWPDMEAVKKREQFEKEELEVFKYVDSKTYIGSPESFEDYGKESGKD